MDTSIITLYFVGYDLIKFGTSIFTRCDRKKFKPNHSDHVYFNFFFFIYFKFDFKSFLIFYRKYKINKYLKVKKKNDFQ